MLKGILITTAILALSFMGYLKYTNRIPSDAPLTVEKVELPRYLGKWYEIASIPMYFQKNCRCTHAQYSLGKKGKINVDNSCRFNSVEAIRSHAYAKAWPQDATNSKLWVQFFWPFKGHYWIVDLEPNYQWAIVSNPTRSLLWILSRTRQMNEDVYSEIIKKLKEKKLPIDKLVKTDQSCDE